MPVGRAISSFTRDAHARFARSSFPCADFIDGSVSAVKIILVCIAVALSGCGEDATQPHDRTGSLYVQVFRASGEPLPNADVWFEGGDQVWRTGGPGDILIQDLNPSLYVVWAGTGPDGTGRDSVSVGAADLSEVRIDVDPALGVIPVLESVSSLGDFSYIDSVEVHVQVSDRQDRPEVILLEWESDIDGPLGSAHPDTLGHAILRAMLSLGTHQISVAATDSDGHTADSTTSVSVGSRAPRATIGRPRPFDIFVPGDSVLFEGAVFDWETPGPSLTVRWTSDLDGVLDTSPPDADGSCGFTTATLSRGIHSITLHVTDGDGNKGSRTAAVNNSGVAGVHLDPIVRRSNANQLTWSASDSPEFASYAIYRTENSGPAQWMTTIMDRKRTSYEDHDIELGEDYSYWVRAQNRDGQGVDSNRQNVRSGVSTVLGRPLSKVLPDPHRPWIYALARPGDAIYFCQPGDPNFVVLEFPGRDLTDMDIAANGDLLYAIDFAGDEILVIDLASQALVRTIPVPATDRAGDHFHIEAGRTDRVYWVDAAWQPTLHVLDATSGIEMARLDDIGVGDLEIALDGRAMYLWYQFGWHAGQAGSFIYRLDCSSDPPLVDERGVTNVLRRDPLDTPILLTADGGTVFCKGYAFPSGDLAKADLMFSEPTYAISPNASFIFSQSVVYGRDASAQRRMPLVTRVLATSPDGSLLYLGDDDGLQLFVYELSADLFGDKRAGR